MSWTNRTLWVWAALAIMTLAWICSQATIKIQKRTIAALQEPKGLTTEPVAEIRGRGEWPKFSNNSEGVIEYSSNSRRRIFRFVKKDWSRFFEYGCNIYLNGPCEAPVTPAEAARLTSAGRGEG